MHNLKRFAALLGFALALAGIALGHRALVWGAIGSLAVSFLLRTYQRRRDDAA